MVLDTIDFVAIAIKRVMHRFITVFAIVAIDIPHTNTPLVIPSEAWESRRSRTFNIPQLREARNITCRRTPKIELYRHITRHRAHAISAPSMVANMDTGIA